MRPQALLILFMCAASTVRAADDPLSRARLLYNQRQFVAAVNAAEQARLIPAHADSADLIAARAVVDRKPLAASLAGAQSVDGAGGDANPGMIHRRVGAGQVLSIGVDGLWRGLGLLATRTIRCAPPTEPAVRRRSRKSADQRPVTERASASA
jgi:hypothetical protein